MQAWFKSGRIAERSVRGGTFSGRAAFLCGRARHQAAQLTAAAFKLAHFALVFAVAHLHEAQLNFDKIEQRFYRTF